MYTITLADGTILDNLLLNGNNFISDTRIDEAVFDGNLNTVHIMGPGVDKTFDNLDIDSIREDGGKYWFVLRRLSDWELWERDTRAEIRELSDTSDDIILMMADLIGG